MFVYFWTALSASLGQWPLLNFIYPVLAARYMLNKTALNKWMNVPNLAFSVPVSEDSVFKINRETSLAQKSPWCSRPSYLLIVFSLSTYKTEVIVPTLLVPSLMLFQWPLHKLPKSEKLESPHIPYITCEVQWFSSSSSLQSLCSLSLLPMFQPALATHLC